MLAAAISNPLTCVRRQRNWMRHMRSVMLGTALAACAEPTAPAAPRTDAQATLSVGNGVSAQSIPYSNVYTWSQGDPPTFMGANGNPSLGLKRVCYLTRVSGRFRNYNETVDIYLVGNNWYLGGSSNSAGVGAFAHCMTVLDYSKEYMRFSGSSSELPHDSKWMCFLTGLGGQLAGNDGIGLDRPDASPSNKWRLWTDADGGSNTDLWAAARCARPFDGTASFVYTGDWQHGEAPQPITTSDGNVCVLHVIWGPFSSSASYINVFRVFGDWWISGGSNGQQEPEYAVSRCYSG
jgi:hypothetical protein